MTVQPQDVEAPAGLFNSAGPYVMSEDTSILLPAITVFTVSILLQIWCAVGRHGSGEG